ncbi:MAG: hypothetical protein HY859_03575 [Caulobacterales bacterium]|nr:hypothetical protein [Caulobacterales bacterium]
MIGQSLFCVFEIGTVASRQALETISAMLVKHGLSTSDFSHDGRPARLGVVAKQLEAKGKPHFSISAGGVEYHLATVGGRYLQFIQIESPGEPDIPWGDWVDAFADYPGFLMAWVVDAEYNYWQNASDPLLYKDSSRSMKGLPTRPNGLPYPLAAIEIDTSRNPGRYVLRDGYIEAVGATMWVGQGYWAKTKISSGKRGTGTHLRANECLSPSCYS